MDRHERWIKKENVESGEIKYIPKIQLSLKNRSKQNWRKYSRQSTSRILDSSALPVLPQVQKQVIFKSVFCLKSDLGSGLWRKLSNTMGSSCSVPSFRGGEVWSQEENYTENATWIREKRTAGQNNELLCGYKQLSSDVKDLFQAILYILLHPSYGSSGLCSKCQWKSGLLKSL